MSDDSDKLSRKPTLVNHDLRLLSEAENSKLTNQNNRIVSPFMAAKLEADAEKHWDQFYNRNSTHFFKDRHWTTAEFHELSGSCSNTSQDNYFLEVGCGVGNLFFPLAQEKLFSKMYACDFSKRAVEFVKINPLYDENVMHAFHADVTKGNLLNCLNNQLINIVSMVFVLSAIHPSKFVESLRNVFTCIKPGGLVLFRDYAVNDMTQIRFKPGHKLEENLYVRQDGTRTYFFTIEKLTNVFEESGFSKSECYYVHNRTINKKEGVDVPRTFIQGKFYKSNSNIKT